MANIPFLNNAYFAAKVGIGTETPLDELQIGNYTGSNSLSITSADGANYAELKLREFSNNYGVTFKLDSNLDILNILYHNNSTSGQSAMAISRTTGNVGIGVTSPAAKLTIGDPGGATTRSIQIEGNSSTSGMNGVIGYFSNGLYLSNNYYYNSAQVHPVPLLGQTNIACITSSTTGGNFIEFAVSDHTDSNNAPDTRMRIMDNGNVGIGTTLPQEKLHVYNAGVARIEIEGTNDSTAFKATNNAGSYGWYVPGANNSFRLFNFGTGSDLVTVNASGNVGIGVTGPATKLHVSSSENANWTTTFQNTLTSDSHAVYTAYNNSSSNLRYGVYISGAGTTASDYHLLVNDQFAVVGSGNVGIGTTSPGAKLDIVGSSLGIRVKKADLSDVLRVYTQGSGIFMDNGNVHISDDLKISATLLSNQENTDVDTGTEVVAQVSTSTYTAAFFDFVIKKVGNIRSGTVYACHDGTNVEFTETSTQDLGDTSDVTLSVDISGGNMRLQATTTSDNWSIKSLIRAI